ncbi:SDR family NAD(P)-dependent oxidoreductase [Variovorax ureilyticus]|uniref:SDR family NAD(P)-dependent oxidoreductase n=1 Tax=Variovorax ureilyticus TaxID=1836198 RepID=A0ABU8VQR3_9BURK
MQQSNLNAVAVSAQTPLAGQRAVLTGGASGIGQATVLALAAAGAEVAVLDIDTAGAEATCEEVRGLGGRAFTVQASVTDPGSVEKAFEDLDRIWGCVDLLINNAGVSGNRAALEIDDAEWRRCMAVNLDGVFYCSRAAGKRMVERGQGAIVNLGSIYSLVAAPQRLTYCASKAAVAMLTKTLAIEWASHGVRVNCVAPGYVNTPLLQSLDSEGRVDLAAIQRRTPQQRLGTPQDMAQAVVYLCEPRSAHITGQVLAVDGGWSSYGYL